MNDVVAFPGRTQEEILQRIEDRRKKDPLGFEFPYYVEALTLENAKPFLIDGFDAAKWKTNGPAEIREQAINYMEFAWGKANDRRGISAIRSIAHYQAWLWLLGVEWADALMDGYKHYGKPQLIKICQYFGLDPNQWDDGTRVNE